MLHLVGSLMTFGIVAPLTYRIRTATPCAIDIPWKSITLFTTRSGMLMPILL
jgi:hypothetical protein